MKKYLIHKLPLRSAKYKSYVESKTLDVRLQRKQFFYYISKRKKDSTGSNPKTKGGRIYMRTSTNQNNCEIDMQWLILFRCDRERDRERGVNDIFPVLKICKNMPCLALTTPVCFIHKKKHHISVPQRTCCLSISRKWSILMDSGHAYVVLPYAIIRYSTDISAYSLITHILLLYSCQIENERSPDILFPVRILHFWKQFIVRKSI